MDTKEYAEFLEFFDPNLDDIKMSKGHTILGWIPWTEVGRKFMELWGVGCADHRKEFRLKASLWMLLRCLYVQMDYRSEFPIDSPTSQTLLWLQIAPETVFSSNYGPLGARGGSGTPGTPEAQGATQKARRLV